MTFKTHLLYNTDSQTYANQETIISLMLISLRKLDEERLVGRVNVNLGAVMNNGAFTEADHHKLSFCSIREATLKFGVVCQSS